MYYELKRGKYGKKEIGTTKTKTQIFVLQKENSEFLTEEKLHLFLHFSSMCVDDDNVH